MSRRDVRSRARAGPRSGRRREARSATRSLDGEKSAKPPLRHRRSAGVACATVRGARGRGIERTLRVLETTIPRASSVSRETSRAACEVRTAITKHLVSRRAHHADVTTRKVLVRDAARRFGSSRAPRRPKVAFAPAEHKVGGNGAEMELHNRIEPLFLDVFSERSCGPYGGALVVARYSLHNICIIMHAPR